MKTLLALLALSPMTVFAMAPGFSDSPNGGQSCGRIIAGLHPAITWGDQVAYVEKINGKAQFDSRTRFKLPTGKHTINFAHTVVDSKGPITINIEPNTNYYIQWVFDKKIGNELYSGPYVFKKTHAKCRM